MQAASAIQAAPDFRHIDVWIFDLDNTLYAPESRLFAQIEARMTLFVQRYLGLDREEARRVQNAYYREHGTTLNGLMRLNGVEPEAYLAFVHDIDISALGEEPALMRAIARLPGRRFVFTNGCRNHAARVLERLVLAHLFEDLWDIRTIAFRPKPDPVSYRAVLARAAASASRSAMFDDIARNLVPAHELGLTTVWLRNDSAWSKQGPDFPVVAPGHVHYETTDLCRFLETIRV
ncbi:MAG TPA: pyrimidine 5'-nucleotidase [Rhizomicrobium sp.]|jgi:putative hydrolase of the HAD superfamily|nr:pyrimidine 5'-nucleotidase [Rhizomicrobium sp.]